MTYAVTTSGSWSRKAGRIERYFDIDLTSYTTNGEVPAAADFEPFNRIDQVIPLGGVSDNGHAWRWDGTKIRAYKTGAAGGIITESWPDVMGGEPTAQSTGSNTTDPVNGQFVIALVTATTAAKTTIAAEPNTAASAVGNAAAGRNLVVQLRSAGGGTLPAAVGNCTLVGTDQFGVARTEVVSLAALNDVVLSAGGEVWALGAKVFATLTSATLSVNLTSSIADLQVSVGLGTIFGLRGKITAESDVQSVRKDGADVASTTYVGSATTHSLDMGAALADDVDIVVQYDAVASSLIDREAASGADVGSCRCLVVGV